MAYGIKTAKVSCNNSAVALGVTTGKIIGISTYGNSGTVYLGAADVNASNGYAVGKDTQLELGHVNSDEYDFDFNRLFVFSASTDGVSYMYLDRDN